MQLKRTLQLNVAWASLMWLAFLILFVGSPNVLRASLLVALSAFIAVAFLAVRGNRWALALSICVAVLLLVRWLPMVVVNFWMFFTNHPLYLDSPATIFIVGINAILFAIPATILVALLSFQWRQVKKALCSHP